MEHFIPPTVYERLPDGPPLAGLYSQVVRARGTTQVHVSGTVAGDADGNLVGEDDMAAQVRAAVENVEASLAAADASMSDVVRTRVFTVDVDRYAAEGIEAMTAAFDPEAPPASSLIGVDRLANPDVLVEIEATAVLE